MFIQAMGHQRLLGQLGYRFLGRLGQLGHLDQLGHLGQVGHLGHLGHLGHFGPAGSFGPVGSFGTTGSFEPGSWVIIWAVRDLLVASEKALDTPRLKPRFERG